MYFLFKDMFGNYIYNSSVNDTFELSDALYQQLTDKSILNKDSTEYCEYSELLNLGYFSTTPKSIIFLEKKIINSMLDRQLNHLILQVTQNCNFRCRYCPYTENDGSDRLHNISKMNSETMKKSIDFFRLHSIDSPSVSIGFYGGEPLLNFEIIKEAMEYSSLVFAGKLLDFSITTNGTLLTDDILDCLETYNVALTISLDGPKKINDQNRVFVNDNESTFDNISKKIIAISEKYPQVLKRLSLNMVLDPKYSISEYQKIFAELPIAKKIILRASVVDNSGINYHKEYSEEFIQEMEYANFLYRYTLNRNELSSELAKTNLFQLAFSQDTEEIFNRIGKNNEFYTPTGVCIPGHSKLFVDVHGDFFPCEKTSELNDNFIIGSISTGFYYDKINTFVRLASMTEEECASCWCYSLCSCAKYCISDVGLDRNKRLMSCNMSKSIGYQSLLTYVSMKRNGEI